MYGTCTGRIFGDWESQVEKRKFGEPICLQIMATEAKSDCKDEDEHDPRMIRVHSSEALPPRPVLGMRLDLKSVAITEEMQSMQKDYEGVQESQVMVVFELPDGSLGETMVKLGQTVEYLKSFVESEFDIPMESSRLFIEDKLMIDPLSLLDYPESKGVDEIFIRVEGPMKSRK